MPVPAPSLALAQPLHFPLSPAELTRINAHLATLSPQQILQWGVLHLPRLHQTTAFGLTGLASIDMLSKLTSNSPPLIFIDTLYHFPETLELVGEVKKRYNVPLHVFKPDGCDNTEAFELRHGERLWETDEISYDYLVKVPGLLDQQGHRSPMSTIGRARTACICHPRRAVRDYWPQSITRGVAGSTPSP